MYGHFNNQMMSYPYQDQSGYYYYSEMGYKGPRGQMLNMQMGNFGPMRGGAPFQNPSGQMGNFQRWPKTQMPMANMPMPNLTYHGQRSSLPIPKTPQPNEMPNSNCDQENSLPKSTLSNNAQKDKMPVQNTLVNSMPLSNMPNNQMRALPQQNQNCDHENRSTKSLPPNNVQPEKMPVGNQMSKEIVPVNNIPRQNTPMNNMPMSNTNIQMSNMPISNMQMSNMPISNMQMSNVPNGQMGMFNQRQMGNMSYPQVPNMTYHGYQNHPMVQMRSMNMDQMCNGYQRACSPYYQQMYAYQQYGQYGQQAFAQQQQNFQQYPSKNQQMFNRPYNQQQQSSPAPVRCTSTDVDGSVSSVSSVSPDAARTR